MAGYNGSILTVLKGVQYNLTFDCMYKNQLLKSDQTAVMPIGRQGAWLTCSNFKKQQSTVNTTSIPVQSSFSVKTQLRPAKENRGHVNNGKKTSYNAHGFQKHHTQDVMGKGREYTANCSRYFEPRVILPIEIET